MIERDIYTKCSDVKAGSCVVIHAKSTAMNSIYLVECLTNDDNIITAAVKKRKGVNFGHFSLYTFSLTKRNINSLGSLELSINHTITSENLFASLMLNAINTLLIILVNKNETYPGLFDKYMSWINEIQTDSSAKKYIQIETEILEFIINQKIELKTDIRAMFHENYKIIEEECETNKIKQIQFMRMQIAKQLNTN